MFIDRVRIHVIAGGGGNGCCSFRREKYVAHGGPNGGDGGNGSAVYIVADEQLSSLLDLRYHPHVKGDRGQHGQGSDRHGRSGQDTIVRVPPGTVIRTWPEEAILADLTEHDQTFCVATGGRGGKGNARFATSINRAPEFCELGEPGEEREYLIELKLIAEVGIVGLPNAGKSTFLSRVSAAHPKIADYPFTTLSPNLGVAGLSDHRTLTIADIPGIIEGAAEGKGLGHEFLRHIERTKVLLFLVDAGDPDPVETLAVLDKELAAHSTVFAERPRLVALNKRDVTENNEAFEKFKAESPSAHFISAVTGEGVDPLLEELWAAVERVRLKEEAEPEALTNTVEYTYEAPFEIHPESGGFRAEGKALLRSVRMTDFTNDEAVRHLQKKLMRMGLFKALERLGAEEGQSIWIGDVELEYRL